ncbi:MAG: polysaccharide pyruvyl transferase CsaB [Candidatus Caenarcaniphilales bacterium]|nr:polysaccharide pyruvyl transferase CsaB [Candidatus Caenarcaniphilales bacterium]
MKALSIIGYYGAGNLGDELLLKSTIDLIVKSFSVHVEDLQINIFSSNKNLTKSKYPSFRALSKFSLKDLLFGIVSSEALIFGGGSVFQDKSSFRSCFYYFAVSLLAKALGKKLVFLGQGIGPFENNISRFLAQLAFRMGDFVSVRDAKAYEFVKSFSSTAKITPDLVWLNQEDLDLKQDDSTENRVLISLRSEYISEKQLQPLIEFFSQKCFEGCQFDLIAFQETDLQVLNKLSQSLNNSYVHEIYSIDVWSSKGKQLFQKAKLSLSMRFHAVLLSIKSGTKCIGLSYDPKVESLCTSVNFPFVKMDSLNFQNLQQKYQELESEDSEKLTQISRQNHELTQAINHSLIKSLIESLKK